MQCASTSPCMHTEQWGTANMQAYIQPQEGACQPNLQGTPKLKWSDWSDTMIFYLSIYLYDLAFHVEEQSADRLVQIMKISLCAIMCEEVRLLPNVLHD